MLQYENNTVGNAKFINPRNWQGVISEPIKESKDLIDSGGVYLSNSLLTKEIQYANKKLFSPIKTSELLNEDNVYQIVDGEPILLTTTNWCHKIVDIKDLAYITLYCTSSDGASDNKIPGVLALSR